MSADHARGPRKERQPQEGRVSVPTLQIHLLGEFRLLYDQVPVPGVATQRLQALFAYLLLHRTVPQPRHHVAALFWPDVVETQARNNLRQLLHHLRHTLPSADHFVIADTHTVCWRDDAPYSLDVAQFEQALARSRTAAEQRDRDAQRDALMAAVALYEADLLPSCYDDWIVSERERLRQWFLSGLAEVVHLLEARRDYAAAIAQAQAWVRQDPLAEGAYRALMRLFALSGDRARALRVYHTCLTVLRRELGVEPSLATRTMHDQLVHLDAQAVPALDPAPQTAAIPAFVGRHREWERMREAWQHASTGAPHVVLVSGEAGIGKTRLAEEFLSWAHRQGIAVARVRSYAAEGQLSLAPVADWLRSEGIRPHLDRLDAVWLTELARIVPEISAAYPNLSRPEPIAEYGQRQRFFDALARAALAVPPPLVLLLDDIQWCDQETLEWLHYLLRYDPSARLLVIATVRVEEVQANPPLRALLLHLGSRIGLTEIVLQPLDAAEVAQLAAQVTGRELALDAVLRLFRETEGVPLFVVESMSAGGHPPDPPLGSTGALSAAADADRVHMTSDQTSLPPRVYAVIAGRLAQLSPAARDLAGLAAAIGRAFTLDMLLHSATGDEEDIVHALDELWSKRIVREQGTNTYDFSHDKLREAAYATLGPPQRRLYHRHIAQAFEAIYEGGLGPVSGQIAAHYEHAGQIEQAIPHYQRAAVVARHVYANDDAIGLLSRALSMLQRLPPGRRRDVQELELLLALSPILRVAKGWAAPDLEQVLDRAQALCDIVGDDAQRWQVLYGLQSLYVVQAQLEKTRYVSNELDTLYRRAHDTAPPRFLAVSATGALLHLGHLRDANAHFAAVTADHENDQLRHLEEEQGANFVVLGWAWQSHALWCLGYPRAALQRCHEAARLAQDLAQPFNQALAAAYLATLAQFCADDATAAMYADDAFALASECKALYYRAWAAILVAYMRAWAQPDERHINQLREAIVAFTATGARLRLPYYCTLVARTYAKAGRAGEGLAILDEALTAARTHNERWWDAEVHRLRGALLRATGAQGQDVEAALLRSLQIARSQEARTLEVRTAIDLGDLWVAQGRGAAAQRLLSDLCASFAEGDDDMPDLEAARLLLNRVS